jgi:hypothetical protein
LPTLNPDVLSLFHISSSFYLTPDNAIHRDPDLTVPDKTPP